MVQTRAYKPILGLFFCGKWLPRSFPRQKGILARQWQWTLTTAYRFCLVSLLLPGEVAHDAYQGQRSGLDRVEVSGKSNRREWQNGH